MTFADRDKYGMYKDVQSAGPGPSLMGADTLIGDSVVNGADEDLGDVKEIMLDMHTGQVAYAVLAFGGFLGMGEKLFAVPWQALHLDTVNKRFVLNVDQERLKTAPGFNKDAWPDMSDMTWANQIHSFYGTDPNRAGGPSMGPGVPMSGMIGGATGAGAAGMGAGMAGSMGAGSAGGAGASSAGGVGSRSTGGMGSGSSGGMGSGSAGGMGAGSAGQAGLSGTSGRPSTAGTSAGISSGSGSSTTGGAGSSSMGSGLGGSSGLGAGTGSGAGGDLGSGTAAGTGSSSSGRSSTGSGTGSGINSDTGLGSASKPRKPGGNSDTDI